MTHEYSVEIQNYISEKLVQVTKKKKEAEEKNDFESLQFYIGQEEELFTLRQYLTEKIDLNTQQYY